MKITSEKVLALTPAELAQASQLHLKNWKERQCKIPKPSLGTIRKDGTARRYIFQETKLQAGIETHVYLDTEKNKLMLENYSKHPETGNVILTKTYQPITKN